MTLTLVTGGTRSGKSAHAERLAAASGLPVRYVATGDASMGDRIAAHVARRPAAWTTVEAGGDLAGAVRDAAGTCVLVDGLGPWIATRLHLAGAFDDAARLPEAVAEIRAAVEGLLTALRDAPAAIVVAEQAGSGVHPPDAASRAWVDLLGAATARLADAADAVDLVVAGRVLPLGGRNPISARLGDEKRVSAMDPALRRHGDRDVRPGDADHAVNVVAGGPPAWLRAALDAALDAGAASYPREDETVAALAAHHGRDPRTVVPANGAAEALWLLGPALRPRLAVCVHPGFTEAEAGLHAHGVPVRRVLRDPEAGFALDPGAVPEDADLVVLGNPASPSGTLDPASAILALRRPGRVVVVDEAFMDLVPGEPGSLAGEELEDVIVVRSLTKALSVPGLRVGYALAPPPLADRLRAVRPPWSANALALATLHAAATHPHELHAIAARAAADREDLADRLATLGDGVRVWPGAANFVLVALPDAPRVVAALREQRIAVRPAASFPGLDERHVRLTARDPEANARLVAALGAALREVAAC
ncbi:bifunctional adenosylcobinamide kinase/adenosylcobinamide-phosphate guanylyltransferase [Paraconexibacter antarcticus]|uniref:Aminotransferase n=1 Tax=Paraconexibacter antarcticus TaxID=2949664 RepID=A0ABY5DRN3_9ACTN|nr:bifunctional adenosylcobinamide kinase/adenosylcobinamide-phosphate guanylyltransferase [Paraconexibacter antarcticus]UTI64120.1 bifunctional adenosylcobinamide kinase/adenosylcobinamide-phosphate guanylyltransferase [Paraconexibacter antarcticus]